MSTIPVSAPSAFHGVVVSASGITGLYQTASAALSAQEVAALDGNGNTAVFEVFDYKSDVSIEVTIPSESPSFMLGEILTITGFKTSDLNGAYILISANEAQANTDFVKISLSMRRFLQNAIPATSV